MRLAKKLLSCHFIVNLKYYGRLKINFYNTYAGILPNNSYFMLLKMLRKRLHKLLRNTIRRLLVNNNLINIAMSLRIFLHKAQGIGRLTSSFESFLEISQEFQELLDPFEILLQIDEILVNRAKYEKRLSVFNPKKINYKYSNIKPWIVFIKDGKNNNFLINTCKNDEIIFNINSSSKKTYIINAPKNKKFFFKLKKNFKLNKLKKNYFS